MFDLEKFKITACEESRISLIIAFVSGFNGQEIATKPANSNPFS